MPTGSWCHPYFTDSVPRVDGCINVPCQPCPHCMLAPELPANAGRPSQALSCCTPSPSPGHQAVVSSASDAAPPPPHLEHTSRAEPRHRRRMTQTLSALHTCLVGVPPGRALQSPCRNSRKRAQGATESTRNCDQPVPWLPAAVEGGPLRRAWHRCGAGCSWGSGTAITYGHPFRAGGRFATGARVAAVQRGRGDSAAR